MWWYGVAVRGATQRCIARVISSMNVWCSYKVWLSDDVKETSSLWTVQGSAVDSVFLNIASNKNLHTCVFAGTFITPAKSFAVSFWARIYVKRATLPCWSMLMCVVSVYASCPISSLHKNEWLLRKFPSAQVYDADALCRSLGLPAERVMRLLCATFWIYLRCMYCMMLELHLLWSTKQGRQCKLQDKASKYCPEFKICRRDERRGHSGFDWLACFRSTITGFGKDSRAVRFGTTLDIAPYCSSR